jgi:hypothetical protein
MEIWAVLTLSGKPAKWRGGYAEFIAMPAKVSIHVARLF